MGKITAILQAAQQRARDAGLPYEGALLPGEAYEILQSAPGARLVVVAQPLRQRSARETRDNMTNFFIAVYLRVEFPPWGRVGLSEWIDLVLLPVQL